MGTWLELSEVLFISGETSKVMLGDGGSSSELLACTWVALSEVLLIFDKTSEVLLGDRDWNNE